MNDLDLFLRLHPSVSELVARKGEQEAADYEKISENPLIVYYSQIDTYILRETSGYWTEVFLGLDDIYNQEVLVNKSGMKLKIVVDFNGEKTKFYSK